jgi:hypothetical protein
MKRQIETAKTMASESMMIESVRLLWELVDQPAGRTESNWVEAVGARTEVDGETSSVRSGAWY